MIIGMVVIFLFVPISNVSAFEPDLYEGFFITYGKCESIVDADNEALRIMFSKMMNNLTQDSFCDLLENSKFVYDYMYSGEVGTKKIKFGEETPVRFYTKDGDGRLPVVLGENWKVGQPLSYRIGDLTELQYNGLNEKKIKEKTIQVHEFGAETYYEEGGNVGEAIVNIQYDSKSGLLVSFKQEISFANVLVGGGSAMLDFEANDISEKPLIQNIVDTGSKDGGCLIATATYGTELSPQVQQLRELRDNSLLQTESGTSFMSGFNSFYYSFSPTIADWERESPIFKEIVKITLTPMISSLSILNYVDMDSEESVLGYGLSLIILNLGMYFVAPAIVIHTIRKKF